MSILQDVSKKVYKIYFDNRDLEQLFAVQNDTNARTYQFQIISNNGLVQDLANVTLEFTVQMGDKKQSVNGKLIDSDKGIYEVTLTSSMLQIAGVGQAQITLIDSTSAKLSSKDMTILIRPSLEFGGGTVEGEDLWFTFKMLTDAIADSKALRDEYTQSLQTQIALHQDVTDKHGEVVSMYATLESVFASETERINAENARVSAENARVTAENTRVTAENARIDAEDTRKTNEESRVTAEEARVTAEVQRDTDEDTRVANETIRQSNESTRVSRENTRQTNETTRQSAESTRQTNETGRVNAETARHQQWQTWEGLIEDGVMPNATSTTAGVVKVDAMGTEDAPHTVVTTDKLASELMGKVDKVTGKGLSEEDYTTAAKEKVDAIPASPKYTDTVTTINGKTGAIAKSDITALGIPAQDTVYTHPSTHPASIITQDSTRRMVSDTQIAAWNGKVDKAGGQMTGALVAQPSGNTRQARNIAIGTTAPTSTTGYSEGDIFLVIE